jgi:hypothetical protein
MGFLLLGIDSLIAGIAIGALVDRRTRPWLASLFGLADGVAFLIGAGLGVAIFSEAASEVLEVGLVLVLGVYLLVVAAGLQRMRGAAGWAVWVLPFALTFDNLTFGLADDTTGSVVGQAVVQALSSALLAFIGLAIAAWLPRVLPAARNHAAAQVAGAGLIVASGALFLVG